MNKKNFEISKGDKTNMDTEKIKEMNEEIMGDLHKYFEKGSLYDDILQYCCKKYNVSIPKIEFVDTNPFNSVSNFHGGLYIHVNDTMMIDRYVIDDQEIMCVTLAQIMVSKFYNSQIEPDGYLIQNEGTALGLALIAKFGIISERMKSLYLNKKGKRTQELIEMMFKGFLEEDDKNECV